MLTCAAVLLPAVIVLIDAAKILRDAEWEVIAKAEKIREESKGGVNLILVLNKVDLVDDKKKLIALTETICGKASFSEVFMVSVDTNDGVDDLEDFLYSTAKPCEEWEYTSGQRTPMTDYQRVVETIREKAFCRLNKEVPYELEQRNIDWFESPKDGSLRIEQQLLVTRKQHIHIYIGKGGATLAAIKRSAQSELSKVFGRKVYLLLHVALNKDNADPEAVSNNM